MVASVKDRIRDKARDLGFGAVGFAPAAGDPATAAALARFVDQGRHGTMDWMAETRARRGRPVDLWPDARTVIALGMNYGTGVDPLSLAGRPDRGMISTYARNRDYHDTVKKRLKHLARWLVETQGGEVKVFVDTAPVMEKPAAARAGLGWQGKHTNLVSRDFGSWLFLGEVFTTLDLPPDAPMPDHCGTCTACIDACPTGALDAPYRIDGRKCVSYLTIEHKGMIEADLMAAMGNRVYGCDDCLAVCPWNRFEKVTAEPDFLPRLELTAPRLTDLAVLDEAAFRQVFAGSPIKRTGRDRLVRNALIAIGNSGDGSLRPVAERLTKDAVPLVRDTAKWAVQRLVFDRAGPGGDIP
ncbi:MAG: tRNA epoxyqueuosine(34) reductase QueG [Rhodobacterales bacterium]|nr:tRNA epoxyqueuosine(34) reductase QueG [Rhodobacterales bacterium]